MTNSSAVGSTVNGVLFGHERELFLAHGGHFVFDYATGKRQVAPENFVNFSRNILERSELAQSLDAQYLHVIFPDKQSVLRERFPVANPVCLAEVYQTHCGAAWKHVFNLTDALRQAREPVFKRTDTHLNDYGLALASSLLVAQLTAQSQHSAFAALASRRHRQMVEAGDLGSKLEPKETSEERYLIRGCLETPPG